MIEEESGPRLGSGSSVLVLPAQHAPRCDCAVKRSVVFTIALGAMSE